jgi:hypothetical protein
MLFGRGQALAQGQLQVSSVIVCNQDSLTTQPNPQQGLKQLLQLSRSPVTVIIITFRPKDNMLSGWQGRRGARGAGGAGRGEPKRSAPGAGRGARGAEEERPLGGARGAGQRPFSAPANPACGPVARVGPVRRMSAPSTRSKPARRPSLTPLQSGTKPMAAGIRGHGRVTLVGKLSRSSGM